MKYYFELRETDKRGGKIIGGSIAIDADCAENAQDKAAQVAREAIRHRRGCDYAVLYGQCFSCTIEQPKEGQ